MKVLGLLFSILAFLIAPVSAKAQNPQACQWNYAMINGVATATYCGNVNISGSLNPNTPTLVTPDSTFQSLLAAPLNPNSTITSAPLDGLSTGPYSCSSSCLNAQLGPNIDLTGYAEDDFQILSIGPSDALIVQKSNYPVCSSVPLNQWVNMGFYPASPSGFSSAKTLTNVTGLYILSGSAHCARFVISGYGSADTVSIQHTLKYAPSTLNGVIYTVKTPLLGGLSQIGDSESATNATATANLVPGSGFSAWLCDIEVTTSPISSTAISGTITLSGMRQPSSQVIPFNIPANQAGSYIHDYGQNCLASPTSATLSATVSALGSGITATVSVHGVSF